MLTNRDHASLGRRAGKHARRAADDHAAETGLHPLEARVVMSSAGFFGAIPIHIHGPSGEASATGQITGTGQRFFRFTADQTGLTALTVNPKIPLNATLEVYDASGRLLARPAAKAGAGRAEGMVFEAFRGKQYFVRVLSEGGTKGRFALDIDAARAITPSHGDAVAHDRLDFKGDEDGFNFTADRTGPMTVILLPSSSLDGQIRIYNASGGMIGSAVDRQGRGGAEIATIDAVAGQTYRIVVSGRNGQQGAYTIALDGHFGFGGVNGGAPAGWRIDVPANTNLSGTIGFVGDEDLFSFVSGGTGSARFTVTGGAGLDAMLRVYDDAGRLMAERDRTGVRGTEVIDLSVQAGRRYYVVVDGYRSTTGAYSLRLQTPTRQQVYDDHANAGQFTHATPVQILASSGNGQATGVIESRGDSDLFRFTAAGSGTVWVRINPTGGLDSIARSFDSQGRLIQRADSAGAGRAEWLRIDAIAGETYYVEVSGYGSSTGGYRVEIDGPAWNGRTPLGGSGWSIHLGAGVFQGWAWW